MPMALLNYNTTQGLLFTTIINTFMENRMNRITLFFATLFSLCVSSTSYGDCICPVSYDVKNDTPYKVTFMYRWTGCGIAKNGYLKKHHKRKFQVQSGHIINLGKSCFWEYSQTLTPYSLSTGQEMVALRLYNHTDADFVDKTLKYDPKKVGNNIVDGFYWVDN